MIKRLTPATPSALGDMIENTNGEYVRYEDMQQTVKLAVQYTLTGVLETKLNVVLNAKIDAEVAKFWEALGYVQDSSNNSMANIDSDNRFDDDRHL